MAPLLPSAARVVFGILRAMRTRPELSILLVALLVLAVSVPTASARVPRGFFGVTLDRGLGEASSATQRKELARMARSGVESMRTVFFWSRVQPIRNGPIGFAATDRIVEQAALRRIQLTPIVIYAPEWARGAPKGFASPPARSADYARYVGALVDRYGRHGRFWKERPDLPRRPVRSWQIWNEPHLSYQWDVGEPDNENLLWAKRYVALLRASHRAIKRRDRGAKVVLAGLTGESWKELPKIYRAGGRRYFDIAALHPYTRVPKGAVEIAKRARRSMRAAGDRRKPIWLTEASWPAARGRIRLTADEQRLVTDDAGMARRVTSVYRLMASQRRRLRVQKVFWYTWASEYKDDGLFDFGGLGVFRDGRYTPKPALRAFVRSARRYERCVKTSTGACRR